MTLRMDLQALEQLHEKVVWSQPQEQWFTSPVLIAQRVTELELMSD